MGSDFLNYLRRFDEAQAAVDRALEISPNDQSAIVGKAGIFQSEDRLDEAAKELTRIPADSAGDEVVFARADQAIYERRFDAAIGLIETKIASLRPGEAVSNNFLVRLGHCQEWAGQAQKARASYTRLIQTLKTNALDEAHRAVAELANERYRKTVR